MCVFHADPLTGGNPTINRINAFLASPYYILAAMMLTLMSNILCLEMLFYGIVTVIVIYVCLLGKDLLPLMPLMVCCYIAPSVQNNPGKNAASIFSAAGSGTWILVMGGLIALAVVYRVLRMRHQFAAAKYSLLPGILALSGAYLLSGIGSAAYPDSIGQNLLFAGLQCACILLPYLLSAGGVDWKSIRKDYFAWIGFCAGGVLLLEVLWIYLTGNVIENGVIIRNRIFTGWGMHNNLGVMLAITIPSAFYLATKYHRGWIGTVIGSLFFIGTIITCSRSSIIGGGLALAACILLMLHYARNRRHNTIALLVVISLTTLILVVFRTQLLHLFSGLLSKKLDPSSRDVIFAEGLKLFTQAPIFGSSFYSPGYIPWDFSTVESFSAFFPPRWHNTIIQLLASCGLVGIGAYIFHRFQTVKLFLFHYSKESAFIGCATSVLLLCSLLDCHFFNLGPVLYYSMALAFVEHCPGSRKLKRLAR